MDIEEALRLHDEGRREEAERAYRSALTAEPNNAAAYCGLGTLLCEGGRQNEGLRLLHRAVELRPREPAFRRRFAAGLDGAGHAEQAVEQLDSEVRLCPDSADAHYVLAAVLERSGHPERSLAHYGRAIALQPDFAKAYAHRGNALTKLGRADEAAWDYRRTTDLCPNDVAAWERLAHFAEERARLREAIDCYQRLVEMRPEVARYHTKLLVMKQYDPRYSTSELFEEAVRWARRHEVSPPAYWRTHENPPDPSRRLRVGYLSCDFREGVVSRLIIPVLEHHDRERFDVLVYGHTPPGLHDAATNAVRDRADQWQDITDLTDEQAEALIRMDEVDLLVDCSGHFSGRRLSLVSRRPAPLQVAAFGYCATMGMRSFDYRITDVYSDPPGQTERFHVEGLARLPDCAWCYAPWDRAPDVGPLPATKNGYVTFCNLNNPIKTTEVVYDVWAKLLLRVRSSRLMLLCRNGSETAAAAAFGDRGVDPSRLAFVTPRPRTDYLQAHNSADIALDPFPFNGDNTTCDAMWMGVPAVTLEGDAFLSRRGVSHLRNVGLDSCVAGTPEDYVEVAARLASDLPRLTALRMGLRDRLAASPLGSAGLYIRQLEAAYRGMWTTWCGGKASNIGLEA